MKNQIIVAVVLIIIAAALCIVQERGYAIGYKDAQEEIEGIGLLASMYQVIGQDNHGKPIKELTSETFIMPKHLKEPYINEYIFLKDSYYIIQYETIADGAK